MNELSDGQLLEAVREGNSDAYATLFVRHRENAIRTAGWVLNDQELAQDAAHEAFSTILAAIEAGSGPHETFNGYLRATVKRVAYRMAHQRTMETPVEEHPEFDHPVEDSSQQLFDSTLREAFVALPRRWQMALWYLEVEDRTPKDVASLFDLTPNAMVALHRRAKKGLARAYLEQDSDGLG